MSLKPAIQVFQSNPRVMLTARKVFKLIIEAEALRGLNRLEEAINCLEEGVR